MLVDLSGDELWMYRSSQQVPDDFNVFWRRTLDEARGFDLDLSLVAHSTPMVTVDVYDVSFRGFGGHEVRAWLRVPRGSHGPLPVIIEFVGYGGGRGLPEECTFWANCGFAHLQMDTRGQGSVWSAGDTVDPAPVGPHAPGFMTAGIESPENYYYRRLITDAVRLTETVEHIAMTDPMRVTALGGSQGGGLAIAAAALSSTVTSLVAYVPFLCDFPRAVTITNAEPYKEISRYLAVHRERQDSVMGTLRYFDAVNFARHATIPALFTTSLMDEVCPPSTVMGAYQEYAGPKEIRIWSHNGHEGGASHDDVLVARDLKATGLPAASLAADDEVRQRCPS